MERTCERHISEDDLIDTRFDDSTLLHLAKTPIADKDKHLVQSHDQLYALGFNAGGRPDGLWLSQGSTWLKKAKELNNPKFPVCCYIYSVVLKTDAKLLYIRNDDDFVKFDEQFPSYWLNMDYFTLDFTDYVTGKLVTSEKKYQLNLDKLRKRSGESFRSILINNNIIFTSAERARKGCAFYKKTKMLIERFKYKDWKEVASKYQGIVFDNWNFQRVKSMEYFWFQSLDVSSSCIWDISCIQDLKLLYNKIDSSTWKEIK